MRIMRRQTRCAVSTGLARTSALGAEVGGPDANDRRCARPCRWRGRRGRSGHDLIIVGLSLRPDAVHAPSVRREPLVIAEERVFARKWPVGPCVVRERFAAI